MQIIIVGEKTLIINDIIPETRISEIKQYIEDKLGYPKYVQILTYMGNNLDDDKCILNYNIKNNNFVFLSFKIVGGNTTPGFPNVGNLVLLLLISSLMTLGIYYFFYLMMYEIRYKTIKPCPNQSGGQYDIKGYIFSLITLYYASTVTIILTNYLYTMFCNINLSNWLIVIILSSLLLIFVAFIIMYKLTMDKILEHTMALNIGIGILSASSLIILIASIIIPKISGDITMSWWTYIYPIGVLLTGGITYLLRNSSTIIKILLTSLSIILFIFIPYTMAYVYNNYHMCKGKN